MILSSPFGRRQIGLVSIFLRNSVSWTKRSAAEHREAASQVSKRMHNFLHYINSLSRSNLGARNESLHIMHENLLQHSSVPPPLRFSASYGMDSLSPEAADGHLATTWRLFRRRLSTSTNHSKNSLFISWAFRIRPTRSSHSTFVNESCIHAPDNVWAVDRRFGRQIWHYTPNPKATTSPSRLANVQGLLTSQAHVLHLFMPKMARALEVNSDGNRYFPRMVLLIKDQSSWISGTHRRSRLLVRLIRTPRHQWRWDSTKPGEPGSELGQIASNSSRVA